MIVWSSLVRVGEVMILMAAAWPPVRLIAERGFRRKLLAFPRPAGIMISGILATLCVVAIGIWRSPLLLHVGAVFVAVLALLLAFRGRTTYGRRRGLPPGSLSLMRAGPWRRHDFYETESARLGPVFKVSNVTQPTICVVDLALGISILKNQNESLRASPLPFNARVPGGFLRYMNADLRPAYRTLFRRAFSRQTVERCEATIQTIARSSLGDIVGTAELGGGTQLHDKIHDMVFRVMSCVFLGIHEGSLQFARLKRGFSKADFRRAALVPPWRVSAALREIEAIVVDRAASLSLPPTGESERMPSFLGNIALFDERAVTDPTVVGNLIYMMQTACADVSGMLHWSLAMLAQNPLWASRLSREVRFGRADDADALAVRIVRETLRLEQSEYLIREITREFYVGELRFPKGWMLRVCVREAHRNEKSFESPLLFDPGRFEAHRFKPESYSPFGALRTSCLGEQLALEIGRIFLTELSRVFDWAGVSGEPEYNGFHWQPGPFQIKRSNADHPPHFPSSTRSTTASP